MEDEAQHSDGEATRPAEETVPQPDQSVKLAQEETGRESDQSAELPQEEIVEGLPVLAEVRPVQASAATPLPAVQAAAAAATGFVAGAAAVALVRRRAARRLARSQGLDLRRPAPGFPSAGAGRTFLVHVRVLGREGG